MITKIKMPKVVKNRKGKEKTTLTLAQQVGIMEPDNEHGYTTEACKRIFSKEDFAKFCKWMNGQTCSMDSKTGDYIAYTYDVTRFVNILKHKGVDIWD